MDLTTPVAYEPERKTVFHRDVRKCLKALAVELGFPPESYDLRSNKAGIAVSGEITLHHEDVYVQVSQSITGAEILMRHCQGRKDYTGGPNNFAPITALRDIPGLALRVRAIMTAKSRAAA